MFSPHERFVLFPEELKISKSMRQVLRSGKFRVTMDQDFKGVISACARVPREGQDGTWITPDMQAAYLELHRRDYAHSVEVWQGDDLVGGLYGVNAGRVFCGESMFSLVSNASKTALIYLATSAKYDLIDCQVHTGHLESMGARMISRDEYLEVLSSSGRL